MFQKVNVGLTWVLLFKSRVSASMPPPSNTCHLNPCRNMSCWGTYVQGRANSVVVAHSTASCHSTSCKGRIT